MKKHELGALGEKAAKEFLKKKGYRIIDCNFRCPHGEIDIIATKDGYVIFVEVRTKSSSDFGTPEESITKQKRDRLVTTALTYLAEHPGLPENWRIDVMAIRTDYQGKVLSLSLLENALA